MNNDGYIFHHNLNPEAPERLFSGKKLKWANDNQMGVSHTFSINSRDISTDGDICALSEAYIAVPYLIALTATGANGLTDGTNEVINAAFCQLKSGLNLFDSLSLQWNGETINTTQQHINQLLNFKVLATYGEDEYKKWSDQMMFAVDETASITASGSSATSQGDGYTNNVFTQTAATSYATGVFTTQNPAMIKRARTILPQTTSNKGFGSVATTSTKTDMYNCGVNHFSDDGNATITSRKYYYNLLITLRLQDLFDIFNHLDLCVSPNFQITATLNAMKATITTTATGTKLIHSTYQTLSGNTNPVLVSSAAALNPNNSLVAGMTNASVISIEASLPKANGTINGTALGMLEAVRLYIPTYTMTPRAFERLSAETDNGWKTVYFEDYVYFPMPTLTAGSSFSQQIAAGENDLLGIVVIPQLASGSSGNNTAITLNPRQSLFDTSPNTTAPLATFQNLNFLVGGEQIWMEDMKFSYAQFITEVNKLWSINNGNSDITSGLLTEQNWLCGHSYLVADLSRKGLGYTKSVVMKGQVQGTANLNLHVFLIKLKCLQINILTGESKLVPLDRQVLGL